MRKKEGECMKTSTVEAVIPMTGQIIPLNRSNVANAQATNIELVLPDDLPFDEWAAIGDALCHAEQSVMWWIGDWWAYGYNRYGERARALEDMRARGHNPPAFKTCARAGTVSRQFTSARRRALLSFEHHKEVAALDEREQDWLLDRAQSNAWSVVQLREEVRGYKLERLRRPGDRKYETQTMEDLGLLVESGRKFGTIYADPPWPYGNQATRAATKNHYKRHNDLSVEDICNLPVDDLAAEAAHCHLWTTTDF
jgi:hypothetical protein